DPRAAGNCAGVDRRLAPDGSLARGAEAVLRKKRSQRRGADADGGAAKELAAVDQELALGDRVHRRTQRYAGRRVHSLSRYSGRGLGRGSSAKTRETPPPP